MEYTREVVLKDDKLLVNNTRKGLPEKNNYVVNRSDFSFAAILRFVHLLTRSAYVYV